jgi:peptidoglycan/LPS O-acetylase OafA/YrhL
MVKSAVKPDWRLGAAFCTLPLTVEGGMEKCVPSEAAISVEDARSTGRLVFLDALRFLAAGAVLLQHALEREGELGSRIVNFLSPGVFGVVLFFAISGFVIPMAAKGNLNIWKFCIRRIFRVYPLAISVFIILGLLGYCTDLSRFEFVRSATLTDWIANLLLVQDYVYATPLWGVTWTLSLEFAWYIIFAISLMYVGKNFDDILSLVVPGIMLILAMVSLVIEHRLPLGRIGMLYVAILGCRVYRSYSGKLTMRRLAVDVCVFVATVSACNAISFGYFRHPNISMNQALYPWLVAPLLFVVVACVQRVREAKILNNNVVGALGTVSFSTYLLHPFAIIGASIICPADYVLLGIAALTLVFSVAGYWLVEVPGQSLSRLIIASTIPNGRYATASKLTDHQGAVFWSAPEATHRYPTAERM